LRADGPSFFRRFSGRYRQAVADLRALCKAKPPKKLKERIALMEKLQNAQASRQAFSEQIPLSAALGPIWNHVRTKWDDTIALLEWTRTALSLLGKERLVELAAGSQDLGMFNTFAERLETLIQPANKASTEVGAYVKPGSIVPFGEATPIYVLSQLTTMW